MRKFIRLVRTIPDEEILMTEPDEDAESGSDSRFAPLQLSYEPNLPELLNCVYNIRKSEVRTLLTLNQHKNAGVHKLADEIDLAESTVREQVNTLREKELVTRDTRVEKQGTHHTYQAHSNLQGKLRNDVNQWALRAIDRIRMLEKDSINDSQTLRSTAMPAPTSTDSQEVSQDDLPSLGNMAKWVFGLTKPEMKTYLVLLNNPRRTAEELAEVQDLARTTLVGRLNSLQERGLARPIAKETDVGNSIAYEYIPCPLDDAKEEMVGILEDEWVPHALNCVEEFDFTSVDYRE